MVKVMWSACCRRQTDVFPSFVGVCKVLRRVSVCRRMVAARHVKRFAAGQPFGRDSNLHFCVGASRFLTTANPRIRMADFEMYQRHTTCTPTVAAMALKHWLVFAPGNPTYEIHR